MSNFELTIKPKKYFQELYRDKYRYVLLYGGRGGGKSMGVGEALIIRAVQKPILVLCTREKQSSIQESVYTLLKEIITTKILEGQLPSDFADFTREEIEFKNGSRFIFRGVGNVTIDSLKSLFGVDLCWVEEASSMSQKSLDTLLPTIRKPGSQIFFTYNPETLFDPIATTLANKPNPDTTFVLKINYNDNPYFPEVLEEERMRAYTAAVNSGDMMGYNHTWLGECYPEEDLLIGPDLIKKAQEFKSANHQFFNIIIGVDIAREGGDDSIACVRQGNKILEIKKLNKYNPSFEDELSLSIGRECSNQIAQLYFKYTDAYPNNKVFVHIDNIGVGASPYDFLKAMSFSRDVFGVDFRNSSANKEAYYNLRSQCYGEAKDAMVKGIEIGTELGPEGELLLKQLSYIPLDHSTDTLKIKKKGDIKKKIGSSPDRADSYAITYGIPHVLMQPQIQDRKAKKQVACKKRVQCPY
jgi:phage terminase large subunit